MTYYEREQANEIPIYNPTYKGKKYFKFSSGVYRNPECELTEEEYEKFCEEKGLNPIYPIDKKKKQKAESSLRIQYRSIQERINARRKELSHPGYSSK